MLRSFSKFLHYWYFRYLMVTELYMVEKWERTVGNLFFLTVLSSISYFNCTVTLPFTSKLFDLTINPYNIKSEILTDSILTPEL